MAPDISSIRELVRWARRRLRIQGALDGAALAALPAIVLAVAAVHTARAAALGDPTAVLVCAGALVPAGALIGAARRRSDAAIAGQIDRASRLSDRLATAIELHDRLSATTGGAGDRAGRDGFALAAIDDALRAVPRADVRRATPLRPPRHAGLVQACGVLALLWSAFALPAAAPAQAPQVAANDDAPDAYEPAVPLCDECYFVRAIDDLHRLAVRAGAPSLDALADAARGLIARLQRGELDQPELLIGLIAARRTFEGAATAAGGLAPSSPQVVALLDDLLEAGRRLPNHPDAAADAAGRAPLNARVEPLVPRATTRRVETSQVPGAGTSRREVISATALQGFATTGYQTVYAEYQLVNEETMHAEQVPARLRHYVKRYFERIHPTERTEP